jgi:pimeloyl-ACP methyl ester carboxylesterase
VPSAQELGARSDWPAPDLDHCPPADPALEPDAFVVAMDTGERMHYLDWGGPSGAPGGAAWVPHGLAALPPLVLLHGIGESAWVWAPIARRVRALTRVLALDLRGHGLSAAPIGGYELPSLAMDVLTIMAANGWAPAQDGQPVVLAGHGFGGAVAVAAAVEHPAAVAGFALVDGGWEAMGRRAGDDPQQVVKALAEPPEVLESMAAWLADRRAFDPPTWDADQERAARAQVEQTHAGHVVPILRRHALLGTVRAMLSYEPHRLLPRIAVPLLVAIAGTSAPDDETALDRELELQDALRLPRGPVRVVRYRSAGHNLMRYVPRELTAELVGLLAVAGRSASAAP